MRHPVSLRTKFHSLRRAYHRTPSISVNDCEFGDSVRPRIDCSRVTLRFLQDQDRDDFLEMVMSSRPLHEPWAYPPKERHQFKELLERTRDPDFFCFIARDAESNQIVGILTVSQIVRAALQSAFLGYYASIEFAGKGLMREAMELTIAYSFGALKLHRLEVNIQPENHASIALATRSGFRLEGFSPRYLMVGGRWRDHERWAMTADEFSAR